MNKFVDSLDKDLIVVAHEVMSSVSPDPCGLDRGQLLAAINAAGSKMLSLGSHDRSVIINCLSVSYLLWSRGLSVSSLGRIQEEAFQVMVFVDFMTQAMRLLDEKSKPCAGAVVSNESSLLSEDEAARLLDVSPGTLQVWRSTKRYDLPYIKVGRNVRYRLSDVNGFLCRRKVDI
jgi:hypothetical protein